MISALEVSGDILTACTVLLMDGAALQNKVSGSDGGEVGRKKIVLDDKKFALGLHKKLEHVRQK